MNALERWIAMTRQSPGEPSVRWREVIPDLFHAEMVPLEGPRGLVVSRERAATYTRDFLPRCQSCDVAIFLPGLSALQLKCAACVAHGMEAEARLLAQGIEVQEFFREELG
jgi:hypothetical protein